MPRFASRLVVLLLFAFAGIAGAEPPKPTLTVFAATSLKESLDEVADAWRTRSGQEVVVSYAASSTLAKQIEQAAGADLFISADSEWMDYLQQKNLIDPGSRANIAGNRLVLVAPFDSPLKRVSLKQRDLFMKAMGEGRLAVAETSSVPAGRYAKQSLTKLGLWASVETRLAPTENVRAALAFVASGDTPLGIVYLTDARAEPLVKQVAIFPDDSHAPIVYPAAHVAASRTPGAAEFLTFLRGKEAQAIFKRAGFLPAP